MLWRAALEPHHFNYLVWSIRLYFLFFRWGGEGPEEVIDLPKVTQRGSGWDILSLRQTEERRGFTVWGSLRYWPFRGSKETLLPGAEDTAADGRLSRGASHSVCGHRQSTAQPGPQAALWLGAEDGDVISKSRMQDTVTTRTAITRQLPLTEARPCAKGCVCIITSIDSPNTIPEGS